MSKDGQSTAVTRIDTPRRTRLPAEPTTPATRLGHFQLLEAIGRGGMGTVYSAYDLNLDRKVAIKVLREDGATDDEAERNQRLLREAQAMAKLSHPNVVPVYEVGIDEGTVFIVMEYIAGLPLDEWLFAKPRWRTILGVFAQAGRGLAAAHQAGIVHRDFKPANVLVDSRGHARVTDFGIAQIGSSPDHVEPEVNGSTDPDLAHDPSTPLTRRGAIVGTPAYMSPEQYLTATVDARSDQFSFCIALYEALFGKPPFDGRHLELAENVKLGRIEKPDPSAGIPGWVTAIVLRGLSTDPDARFASMAALVDALDADPGKRRRKFAIGAAGAVAIAGIAIVAVRGVVGSDDGAACSGMEPRFANVWDDQVAAAVDRSFAMTKAVYASSSASRVKTVLDSYRAGWIAMRSEVCNASRRGEQTARVLDLQAACLDRRLAELRALTALLAASTDVKTVETAVDAASSLTPLAGCTDAAVLLQPGVESTDPQHRARRAELDRVVALRRVGRFKDALAPTRALVAALRAANEVRLLAEALQLRGYLESRTGDLKAAEITLSEALRAARQTGDPDQLVSTTLTLVDTLRDGGISKAREALGVARLAQAVIGDVHDPALAIRLLVTHAKTLSTLGRRDEALPLLQEASARSRNTLGEEHVLSISVAAVLASTLSFNGRDDEARVVYSGVLATATRALGALHPTTIFIRLDHCRSVGARDQKASPPCYAAVLPDADRVIGPADRGMLIAREYLAISLMSLGRNQQAREVLATAYQHVPADAWADKFYVASDIARALGRLELEAGDHRSALEHCQRARDVMEKQHRGLDVDLCIGEAQLGVGDHDRALATLEAARPEIAKTEPTLVGAWRFAYARAVWAARRDAPTARALGGQALREVALLSRPDVDAWLATLPRR